MIQKYRPPLPTSNCNIEADARVCTSPQVLCEPATIIMDLFLRSNLHLIQTRQVAVRSCLPILRSRLRACDVLLHRLRLTSLFFFLIYKPQVSLVVTRARPTWSSQRLVDIQRTCGTKPILPSLPLRRWVVAEWSALAWTVAASLLIPARCTTSANAPFPWHSLADPFIPEPWCNDKLASVGNGWTTIAASVPPAAMIDAPVKFSTSLDSNQEECGSRITPQIMPCGRLPPRLALLLIAACLNFSLSPRRTTSARQL
ncbi:hypothetical protein B0T10DRAFT_466024 [Thelonectria olida]|uniref:Uncharacterized protein n=1 Tax=Thelonectria olida TaxID=1576542 RepID=A0A9P8VQX4_9HYPO|nr:hypothetical protein B0T10DRAFT_466024 [Thelonectria olida]